MISRPSLLGATSAFCGRSRFVLGPQALLAAHGVDRLSGFLVAPSKLGRLITAEEPLRRCDGRNREPSQLNAAPRRLRSGALPGRSSQSALGSGTARRHAPSKSRGMCAALSRREAYLDLRREGYSSIFFFASSGTSTLVEPTSEIVTLVVRSMSRSLPLKLIFPVTWSS